MIINEPKISKVSGKSLKNKYPKRTEDIKEDENEETSALGSLGLKPKPAH